MERQRRSFTEEYKRQAVELVVSGPRSVTSAAKELGVRDSVLRRWVDTSGRPDRDSGLVTLVARTLYNKPTRHQTGAMECLLHGADSPLIKTPDILRTASKVNQSPDWMRITPNMGCLFHAETQTRT
ncbi:transposase [Bradyrhizobium sp. CB1650]|uniref:transposase n=1 Tax=Bradyrhizobium sp. CB1650 TaxID=3039153 RepID=UPI002435CD25|nr:transposase [Bradyrhizobium sp. CB1650]WGD50321.1 transposase [Bradyrhizobium sp. CB1650]